MIGIERIKQETKQSAKLTDPPIFYREINETDFQWMIDYIYKIDKENKQLRDINKKYYDALDEIDDVNCSEICGDTASVAINEVEDVINKYE